MDATQYSTVLVLAITYLMPSKSNPKPDLPKTLPMIGKLAFSGRSILEGGGSFWEVYFHYKLVGFVGVQ